MIVGTAGHIDHGKTSLVQALTGVDTDRLKEEKARGISIDLGFAYLPAPDGSIVGFIDVPGHEAFVRNMLAGATGIDLALLVVAADDGIMPQTREHLMIVDLLGVRHGLIALTKADLVAPEERDRIIADIRQAVRGTGLADADIVPVSAITGEGIYDLRNRLFAWQRQLTRQADNGRFRLAVDRCFILPGAGTVVTGTVLSGQVSVGDHLIVSPTGLAARVRSIHAQNQPRERGLAGERCALNLAGDGVSKDAIRRGDVVSAPELHAPTDRIDAKVRLLATEGKPLAQWTPVRLHHAAADVAARIVLLDDQPVEPGAEAFVQLVLEHPIAAAAGDRFVLRDTTAQRTIGGGGFLDLRAPARKRRTPERLAQLDAMALTDPEKTLSALLTHAPFHVDLTAFARDHALNVSAMDGLIARLGVLRIRSQMAELGVSPAVWLKLKRDLLSALEVFHATNPDLPGIGLERLRLQLLPRLPAPAFLSFLQGLAKAAEIGLQGAWVRLPGHEVRLTPMDEQVWSKVRPLISGAERFRPPRVRDIAGIIGLNEADVRRLFKLLGRMGQVDEVAHDHFFLRDTVAEMVAIAVDVADHAPKGEFTAAQLRDRLDNGRKVAIQILEFFDRHGVTLRRGDLRRMNRHRIDLFRSSDDRQTDATQNGREAFPVGRPDFKSGRGRETVLGGFDSLSLPPSSRRAL
ncbi:selenocysteine-specific elongation factor [Beijerinckia sp. GAS462]|nr:selenocysteine-specific elongation factor [Beijerinckia sp. GAS462]SEC18546.1 selenocysteine-specific elongation factor [Beijerinckia sp. 28-YEA-48]